MTKKIIVGSLVALVLAGMVWRFMPGNDRQRLMKQLDALATQLSKPADEGNGSMMAKMLAFEQQFADSCEIAVTPVSGRMSPEEVSSHAIRMRKLFSTIELKFSRVELVVVDGTRAYADFTATLTTTGNEVSSGSDSRRIHIEWQRLEDKWKITRIEQVETQ